MSLELSRFKRIHDRHKMAVFGFIKNVQSLLPKDNAYYQIHDLIKQTCTIFYASVHEWDLDFISDRVDFIEETNAIRQNSDGPSSSSFLKDVFDSEKHHWRFKVDKIRSDDEWTATIGIWKANTEINDEYPLCCVFTSNEDWAMCGYGYAFNCARISDAKDGICYAGNKYGVTAKIADIVEMHCDMDNLELRFSVNGIDQGVAFKNIEQTKYRAAVNLCEKGDMITLLD